MRLLLAILLVASIATLSLAQQGGTACPSTTSITQDCDVGGDRTVASGDTLRIEGAKVRFTEAGGLTVAGSLVLEDAMVEAAGGIDLEIHFLAGSQVELIDSALANYSFLRVDTADLEADNITLRSSATALDIAAPTTLENVTAQGQDGLKVAADTAVQVTSGNVMASRDAIVAADGASVRFKDTPWTGSIDLDGSAVFEVFWSVILNVTADGEGPVQAVFRDNAGMVQAQETLWPDQPRSFLLPGEVFTASGATSSSPYFVSMVQDGSAIHAHLDLIRAANQELDAHIPLDPDGDEPRWPASAPLRHDGAFPGFSGDGDVRIAWEAADDTLGLHANRAVDRYLVHRASGQAASEQVGLTRAIAFELQGLDDGLHTLWVEAVDLVGNGNASNAIDVLVDTAAPSLSIQTDPAPSPLGAHAGPVTVTVDTQDPASGLRALRWRIGDGAFTQVACPDACTSHTFQVDLDAPGIHPFHVVAQDRAGTTTETVHNITIDTSPPLFIASIEPDLPAGAWHREAPSLHVNATEPGPSGPGHVRWRLGDGPWQNHSANATLDEIGEHTIHVEVTDGAGNVASTQLRHALDPDAPALAVDATGPVGLADWFTGPANATATASDDLSGVERLEYRLGAGAWRPYVQAVALHEDGVHTVTFRTVDAAGNEAGHELDVSIDSRPPRAPGVEWNVLADGRIRADWSRAPPLDAASGIAALRIERGAQSHDVPTTALGHVLVGLPAAEHALRVVATDAAGHESATDWQTVRGGNGTGALASAQDVRGIVRVSPDPTVRSDDLLEVRYHIDGSLAASQSRPPYELRWDTRSLANGPHSVTIVAVDAQGIHHEELRAYNVRNGYVAALADGAWAAAAAVTVALGSAAAAVNGLRSWRREVVA